MNYDDLLIVIPAKLGSAAVPRKNLQRCGGMTLLERTVRFAQALDGATVVVSTEAAEVAVTAGELGVALIIAAYPPEHHGPDSLAADVWGHAWASAEQFTSHQFEWSLYLEPTCPLRERWMVDAVLEQLTEHWSAMTVEAVPEKYLAPRQFRVERGQGVLLNGHTRLSTPRQALPLHYLKNGAAYAHVRQQNMISSRHVVPCTSEVTICVPTPPLVNIDSWADLVEADRILIERGEWYGEDENRVWDGRDDVAVQGRGPA